MEEENEIPFIAIGNEELDSNNNVGKTFECKRCNKKHIVKYGTDSETGKISKMLAYVNCSKDSYLIAFNGKLLK